MKSCIFNCDQGAIKVKKWQKLLVMHIKVTITTAAAESLRMGDEKAWLREAKREADRC